MRHLTTTLHLLLWAGIATGIPHTQIVAASKHKAFTLALGAAKLFAPEVVLKRKSSSPLPYEASFVHESSPSYYETSPSSLPPVATPCEMQDWAKLAAHPLVSQLAYCAPTTLSRSFIAALQPTWQQGKLSEELLWLQTEGILQPTGSEEGYFLMPVLMHKALQQKLPPPNFAEMVEAIENYLDIEEKHKEHKQTTSLAPIPHGRSLMTYLLALVIDPKEEEEKRCMLPSNIAIAGVMPCHRATAARLARLLYHATDHVLLYREAFGWASHHYYLTLITFPRDSLEEAAAAALLGSALCTRGNYKKAIHHQTHTKAILEAQEITGVRRTAIYNALAHSYSYNGDLENAISYYHQTLEMQEGGLSRDDIALISIHCDLASVYFHQKKIKEMNTHVLAAPAICQAHELPEDHPTYAMIYYGKSLCHILEEEKEESKAYLQKAYDIKVREVGECHPEMSIFYSALASFHTEAGKEAQAIPPLKKLLDIKKKQLAPSHPYIATILALLANLYYDHGDASTAAVHLQDAITIWEQQRSSGHPDLAPSYDLLGSIYLKGDNRPQAIIYLQKDLQSQQAMDRSDTPALATTHYNFALAHLMTSNAAQAIKHFKKALAYYEKNDPTHLQVVAIYLKLATAYENKKDYKKSLATLKKALSLQRERQQQGHESEQDPLLAIQALNLMGKAYSMMGNIPLAIRRLNEAVALYEQYPEQLACKVIESYTYLSLAYTEQKNYDEALGCLLEKLALEQELLDTAHLDLVPTYKLLVTLYLYLGEHEQILVYLHAARTILEDEATWRDRKKELASVYNTLGSTYSTQGDLVLSGGWYDRGLAMSYGFTTPNISYLTVISKIASYHYAKGNYGVAHNYYLILHKRAKEKEEKDTPSQLISICCCNIGLTHCRMGNYHLALEWLEAAQEIMEKLLDKPSTVDTARCYSSLGMVHASLGDDHKAFALYEKAMLMLQKADEANSLHAARVYDSRGTSHYNQEAYEEADCCYQQALGLKEATLDYPHPEIAATYTNLGNLYQRQGELERAVDIYLRGIKIQRATQPDHPDLATTCNNLGTAYQSQGLAEEALACYEETSKIWKAKLPEGHVDFAILYNNMAEVCYLQGQYSKAVSWCEKALQVALQSPFGNPYTSIITGNLDFCTQAAAQAQHREATRKMHPRARQRKAPQRKKKKKKRRR